MSDEVWTNLPERNYQNSVQMNNIFGLIKKDHNF